MAGFMNILIFWVTEIYWSRDLWFRGPCCLYHQDSPSTV